MPDAAVPQHCPTPRELDDLELLTTGALAPITRFNEPGSPVTLTLPPELAAKKLVELVDPEGLPLARVAPATGEVDSLTHHQYGPFRRLFEDYRTAERDYYRRTRLFPAHHLVVLKRDVVDRQPGAVRAVQAAFEAARARASDTRWKLHESSPWLLDDLEAQARLMGPGFQPYGLGPENRRMVARFCEEQHGALPGRHRPEQSASSEHSSQVPVSGSHWLKNGLVQLASPRHATHSFFPVSQ